MRRTPKASQRLTGCASLLQSRDDCVRGVNERVITIVGGENHVLQAVGRILKKCLEDPAFEEYRTASLASTAGGSMLAGMQARTRRPQQHA
jgi:hypothetical protein